MEASKYALKTDVANTVKEHYHVSKESIYLGGNILAGATETKTINITSDGNVENLILVGGGGSLYSGWAYKCYDGSYGGGGGGAVTILNSGVKLPVKEGDILTLIAGYRMQQFRWEVTSGGTSSATLTRNGTKIWEYTVAGGSGGTSNSGGLGGEKTTQTNAKTYSGGKGGFRGGAAQSSEYGIAGNANGYMDVCGQTISAGGGSYINGIGSGAGPGSRAPINNYSSTMGMVSCTLTKSTGGTVELN